MPKTANLLALKWILFEFYINLNPSRTPPSLRADIYAFSHATDSSENG